MDVQLDSKSPALTDIVAEMHRRAQQTEFGFSEPEVDNIALVSWHLFRQARTKVPGAFVTLDETFDPKRLADLIRKIAQHKKPSNDAQEIAEKVIDSIEPADPKPRG